MIEARAQRLYRQPHRIAIALAALLSLAAAAVASAACSRPQSQPTIARHDSPARSDAGAHMEETRVIPLGVQVGELVGKPEHGLFVDPAATVLWAGTSPAAIFTFKEEVRTLLEIMHATQTFSPLPLPPGAPSLPNDHRAREISISFTTLPFTPNAGDKGFTREAGLTLDVDGDGVEELLTVHDHCHIEVYKPDRRLFESSASAYDIQNTHRARAGNRDLLYLVLSKSSSDDDHAAPHRSRVLRIDAHGITQLHLGKALESSEIIAVGALNLPGSQAIDELLVLSAPSGGDSNHIYLSRHRPDGHPIDTPREVYLPLSGGPTIEFSFLPQSWQAVVLDHQSNAAFFIQADKTVNWIRMVDLKTLEEKGEVHLLRAVDPAHPKVLLEAGTSLFAIDQTNTYFGWNGAFAPTDSGNPLLRYTSPGPGYRTLGAFTSENGDEALLVVHTRKYQLRRPPFEEVRQAAERFLNPADADYEAKFLIPDLSDLQWNHSAEEERQHKGVELPKTPEEWKDRLPLSYKKKLEEKKSSYVIDVMAKLASKSKTQPNNLQHVNELRSWLQQSELPADTVFEIYRRGTRLASFHASGYLNPGAESHSGSPTLNFRHDERGASVAVSLLASSDDTNAHASLTLIQWSAGR